MGIRSAGDVGESVPWLTNGALTKMLEARTFWRLLERRVEATPSAVMLIDEQDEQITYLEYREAVERAASGLQRLGVSPGSRVSFQLPTRIGTLPMAS